ncbi:MAG TPA: TonB-dependent receptor [Vicinamibacterales bacterium]|nr:TonB-dependent receptor [Vicinamibacterales bacterium]
MRSAVLAALLAILPAFAHAQQKPATLTVTVVDTSGAVLPGATVTLTGLDPANSKAAVDPAKATGDGVATLANLVPGRYSVEAAFEGFETRRLPEIRVRAGSNKQVVMLPIAGHKETVTVGQDRQSAAADPRGSSFGTTLTREQIEQLSDDPDVLRQQLQEMAGPGAVIKVDSFEGGALPSKAQIRSIRISRDQFAAEHHSAGGINIEIITQPGMGPLRMNFGTRIRGNGLAGRSPFTPVRGPERFTNYNVNANGTLIKNKASFGIFLFGTDSYETPNINVALANGERRAEALRLRSPRDNYNLNGNVDYAVTLDQTLRFGFSMFESHNKNMGIGQWDEEERAYQNDSRNGVFRAQQIGPLGRRAFLRTRFQFSWNDSENVSAVEARTIRVHDSFTSGGAQVTGGQHTRTITVGSDLDYVRGNHTWRFGLQADAARWRSDEASNYLGTYTFESLAAYEAGRPRSYTQRIGDPNLRYENFQGAVYAQDDYRVRRNLTLSAGLRYEAQTHFADYNNVMPRFGVTWAPFAAGTTTLRASWGIFHDWFSMNTYEQTLRVDGFHQQEIDIVNPPYPEFNELSLIAAPANRYVLGDVSLPRSSRVSLGIDQRYKAIQASATYAYTRGGAVARGLNLNAPVNGARPDAQFGNIIEVVSDASTRQHQLQTNLVINQGALFPQSKSAPRINWKRTTLFWNYTLGFARNNTEGAFSVAPTGDLHLEWGPTTNDVRHRFNMQFNNQVIKGLGMGIGFNLTSGTPYTLRTGVDDNGDLIFNDRPAGVGRNTERAAMHFALNMNVGYNWTFGPPAGGPPGIGVFVGGPGAAPQVQTFEPPARYRIGIFFDAQNLTNRANYTGYSGTMTSPFFRQATAVTQTRRVHAGVNFGF